VVAAVAGLAAALTATLAAALAAALTAAACDVGFREFVAIDFLHFSTPHFQVDHLTDPTNKIKTVRHANSETTGTINHKQMAHLEIL
jgi:hypothetical protein